MLFQEPKTYPIYAPNFDLVGLKAHFVFVHYCQAGGPAHPRKGGRGDQALRIEPLIFVLEPPWGQVFIFHVTPKSVKNDDATPMLSLDHACKGYNCPQRRIMEVLPRND